MEFEKVLAARRSVRAFRKKSVEPEKISAILEAARIAPSAGNLQAYKIFVVRDTAKRSALCEAAYGQDAIIDAPVVLAFCADPARSASKYGRRGEDLYSVQDATIAAAFAWLAAVNCGISAVWIGAFDEKAVSSLLGTALRPIVLLPLGYAAEEPKKTPRKSLGELVQEL